MYDKVNLNPIKYNKKAASSDAAFVWFCSLHDLS
jgi:hypothetical protein